MGKTPTILLIVALGALAPTIAGASLEEAAPRLRAVIDDQMRRAEETPGDAAVHNDLGNLLLLAREPEAAHEAYRRALTIDPELESARYNLALLLHQRGKHRAAARQLRRLLRHAPDHARARYALGVIHAERDHSQRAVRHYARALELDPHLADPESNAHAVKNQYLTRASLLAYSRQSGALYVDRSYEDGVRIAAQMVGAGQRSMAAEAEMPVADGDAAEEGLEADGAVEKSAEASAVGDVVEADDDGQVGAEEPEDGEDGEEDRAGEEDEDGRDGRDGREDEDGRDGGGDARPTPGLDATGRTVTPGGGPLG